MTLQVLCSQAIWGKWLPAGAQPDRLGSNILILSAQIGVKQFTHRTKDRPTGPVSAPLFLIYSGGTPSARPIAA